MLDPGLLEPGPGLLDGDFPVVHGDFAQQLALGDLHAALHGPGYHLARDFSGDFNRTLGFGPSPQHNGARARFGRRHGDLIDQVVL